VIGDDRALLELEVHRTIITLVSVRAKREE
jgi:hypothetical protein